MSKYAEIWCFLHDEAQEKHYIKATTKDNRWGEFITIVEVNSVNKTIKLLDEDAKTDNTVQKVIDELLEDGYVLAE